MCCVLPYLFLILLLSTAVSRSEASPRALLRLALVGDTYSSGTRAEFRIDIIDASTSLQQEENAATLR